MPYTLFQGGRRRRRRRGPVVLALLVFALACAAAVAAGVLTFGAREEEDRAGAPQGAGGAVSGAPIDTSTAPLAGGGTSPFPLAVRLEDPVDAVAIRFKRPPRSALLFDLDTGRVLWRRDPTRVLPMASLTKMMTALLVAERVPVGAKARVTREALRYRGSGVGMLPRGKRVGVEALLHGLMLPSGNDAAIALAQRAAGTVPAFVAAMNGRAEEMGLLCTRFSSPHGYEDRDNHTCAADLAALARAVLRRPRLARIVRKREAVLPFPIKGGRLYLYNNNPLVRMAYPGVTGLKTGYTDAAGRCLVATARRGPLELGVVLLNSADPATQARQLLDRGFRAVG
jgi:D-alanyl-D-alanine carboxypeptidase (penicillin-binding protein 5/6)